MTEIKLVSFLKRMVDAFCLLTCFLEIETIIADMLCLPYSLLQENLCHIGIRQHFFIAKIKIYSFKLYTITQYILSA